MLSRFSMSSGVSIEESTGIIKTRNDSIKESSFRVANYYSKLGKLIKVSCLHNEELLTERVVDLLKNILEP
ncbi:hypothetical protein DSO57_1013861 [Entomophthora muscae]|nr:hypothetical protein DSO57_1013861 [Entomophthora muscae]